MIKKYSFSVLTVLLWSGFLHAQEKQDWVAKSDANAMYVLTAMAKFAPESMSQFGIEDFDREIIDLKPGFDERFEAKVREVKAELEKRRDAETHPAVRQDLQILVDQINQQLESDALDQRYNYPYFNLHQSLFGGARALLNEQVPQERRQAMVDRLRKYAGLEEGYEPVTTLARAYTEKKLQEKGKRYPSKQQLERDLANNPRFLAGVEGMLAESGVTGYEQAWSKLKEHLADYESFIRETLLPHASTDFRLPTDLYNNQLKQYGVTITAEELIAKAQITYMEIVQEMNAVARLVANARGWDDADYRAVVARLKKEQVEGEAILEHYRERNQQIEDIVNKHQLVTLPTRPLKTRLASEAETAQVPAPHMRPPRLIGNTGEMGEFVLPLNLPAGPDSKETLKMDDFTYKAASWTLSAHEARPGHEMQFAYMVEKGVSLARSLFAFNSVNVEGWALYAEAIIKPYMPLEGQLISLQARQLRAARAMLDPKLQLGHMTPAEAKAFLMREVVLSEAMANQEVERYTVRSPGQATSYYFGYLNLMSIRAETQLRLGDKFNAKAFHDFILAQGLLPPDLLRQAVSDAFKP